MKQWKIWTVERLMGESYKSARLELVMVMIVFTVLELGAEMLRLVVIFSEDSAAAGYHVDFIMINLEVRQDQEAEKNAVGKVLHDLIREAENRNPETVRQSLGRRTHAKNHVLLPEAGENPSLYRKDEKNRNLSQEERNQDPGKNRNQDQEKNPDQPQEIDHDRNPIQKEDRSRVHGKNPNLSLKGGSLSLYQKENLQESLSPKRKNGRLHQKNQKYLHRIMMAVLLFRKTINVLTYLVLCPEFVE